MTYSDINLYLKENLDSPSLDFEWTDEDNQNFFTFIDENTDRDYLKEEENLLEIREAFRDYFESVGYILFQIKDYKIRLKVLPYSLDPADSENLDDIIDIIELNEHLILEEYNGKKDQMLLKGELRKKIFDFIDTLENIKINKKELVKQAVREAFELKDSDIIMVKQDSIFIKLFDFVNRREISSNEENTIAGRFNGIDEDELTAFYKEHFSSNENKNFFNLVARLFVDRYLLDKNISNLEYEKYVFSFIQSVIMEQLINTFDHNDEFFKGFSGYVFRIHFKEVFENIAEFILEEVANSNDLIIDFLKYYSLNIIVVDGKKYKVPALETENGLKWNVLTMLSIVKLYTRTKLTSKALKKDIDKKEKERKALYIDKLTPIEYYNKNNEEKRKMTDKLVNLEHKLDKYYDSLKLAKSENESEELQRDIRLIKKDMQSIRDENKQLFNKAISRIDVNKYMAIEKEIESTIRFLKKEERILKQNEESFKSIKNALVKALTSKKQQL